MSVELDEKRIVYGFGSIMSENKPAKIKSAQLINAKAVMHLPTLLRNAIEVNRSTEYASQGRPYGHVLLAVYSDQDGDYVVRMVVEHNTSKATAAILAFDVVGKLRAVNEKNPQQ